MLDVLTGFARELRAAGLPVSLTELIDAVEAVRHVPLEDRRAFRAALAATLVKSSAHCEVFETVFDLYFSAPSEAWPVEAGAAAGDGGGAGDEGPDHVGIDLRQALYEALMEGDEAAARALARQAVARYAGMEGRPATGGYHLYRTLRHLDLDGLLERLLAFAEEDAGGSLTGLEERLARDEHRDRVEAVRSEAEAEVRRRLAAQRGPQALSGPLRTPLPEDVDFMHATVEDLAALRRALHPLTRKLASRLRRHRLGRRGPLDFRSTVRHSLSYGGVPAEPRFRRSRPAKPELWVVADVSGSVAAFARFTLQLVHAISSQFSGVRSFVFIDGIDEVTHVFQESEDLAEAVHRVSTEADVVWLDGHSDYGHALEAFWERWGQEVTPRTSVLILGDARNNYHATQSWVVAELGQKARRVYWLNPEPRSYWDTGDSVLSQYARHCDAAFECRNLRQLQHAVEQVS